MYLQHFALSRFPFHSELPADQLFRSRACQETAARLRHLLQLRGIGLLTGEAGCGKTSICRHVTDSLHPGRYQVFYAAFSTGSVIDTYQSIAWSLGLPTVRTRALAYRAIRAEISRLVRETRQLPVLILDEAHHLRHAVLQDLRLLTNFQMDSDPRLCLLLVGLTALRRRVAMAIHASLQQRIIVRQHVNALERDELEPYLAHRLQLAACDLPLFEPPALEALFQASRGVPRQINRLAHYSLTAAAAAEARTVSSQHLELACQEIQP